MFNVGVCETEGGHNLSSYDGHSFPLQPSTILTLTQLTGRVGFGILATLRDCSTSGVSRLCLASLEVRLSAHTAVFNVGQDQGKVQQ
jgi:hypothetical protein